MNKTVLIIDDELDLRELLKLTLAKMDIAATAVETVGEAKAALKQQHFDLCLTDMRLPDGRNYSAVLVWGRLLSGSLYRAMSRCREAASSPKGAILLAQAPAPTTPPPLLQRPVHRGFHARSSQCHRSWGKSVRLRLSASGAGSVRHQAT